MSSTNKTTYYELPQFVDNDIFNPLVDDNDAFDKIDTALHNIAGAEADDASEIVGIKSRLDSAEGDIDALEAQNGNSVLTTTAQTLSSAVNELDADVSALDGRVDIVEDDINNASTGLKAKVGALETLTDSLYHGGVEDGSIAYNKLSASAIKKLEDNSKIIFMPVGETGGNCTVIITNDTKEVIMMDTGFTDIYDTIKAEMIKNGITKINYFLLSHYHFDHYGNLASLIADGFIDDDTICYLPRRTTIADWNTREEAVRAMLENNEKIVYNSAETLTVDNFTFEFFNCDDTDYQYYESMSITDGNVYCVMTYVTSNNFTLLMTGDCTGQGLLYNANKFRKVDILQIPHHGYRAEASNMPLYLSCSADYYVVFMPKHFYSDEDDYMRTSNRLRYVTALNKPFYVLGFGVLYTGVGDDEYTFFPNYKPIYANTSELTIDLYVDNSYTGVSYGDIQRPFTFIEQALTFAKTLYNLRNIIIHVVGEYNKPDETIRVYDIQPNISILGEEATPYKFTIRKLMTRNSNVDFEYCNISGAADAVIDCSTGYVEVKHCNIEGDITGATVITSGRGVYAHDNATLELSECVISNKRIPFFIREAGNIIANNVSGVNNECLCQGIQGGYINIGYNSDVAFTKFYGRAGAERPIQSAYYNDKYHYSAISPYCYFRDSGGGTAKTTALDLSDSAFGGATVRVMSRTGAIYEFAILASRTTTPTLVQNAIDATIDPDFAVSVSGKVLSVTYSDLIKVMIY